MPIAVGETFERYEIESLIGRGGMGEVYRAVDTRLRRKVALKVLRPDRDIENAVERLFREARAAAGLSHPNTIAIHDIGEADGTIYLVMELVTGLPLLHYVGSDAAPPARKVGWLAQVARALAAAHKAGVVHRDVKPSNVMVTPEDVVKVLDFGLAKPLVPTSFRTQQGHVLGTPRYMAPEQLAGAEVDARCDQYSFGLVAYELLAGKHPGGALGGAEPPPRLDDLSPAISHGVASIVARTLLVAPRERFASMDDVANALDDAIAGRPVRALMSESFPAETLPAGGAAESVPASTETSPRIAAAQEITEIEVTQMAAAPRPPLQRSTVRLDAAPLVPSPLAASSPSPALAPPRNALDRTLMSKDIEPVPPPPPPPPPPRPAPIASTPPPRSVREARPPRRLTLPLLLGVIVVLGACAYGGAYYGARALTAARGAPPTPSASSPPPPAPPPPLPPVVVVTATAEPTPMATLPTAPPSPTPRPRLHPPPPPRPTPEIQENSR